MHRGKFIFRSLNPLKVRPYHHASNVSGKQRFLHGKYCLVLSLSEPDRCGQCWNAYATLCMNWHSESTKQYLPCRKRYVPETFDTWWYERTLNRSRDRAVRTATCYGMDDSGVGVQVPVGSRIFSSPRHPDRYWGPPSLLSNGYRGFFPRV
jgi:hypothetical protein